MPNQISPDTWNDALAAANRLGIDIANLPDHLMPPAARVEAPPLPHMEQGRDWNGAVGQEAGSAVEDEGPSAQVSAPPATEPADTSKHLFHSPKKICRGIKKSGEACRAYALKDGDLCIYHEADAVTNFREAQSLGGQVSRLRPPCITIDELTVSLHSRVQLHALTEAILRMQLVGAIPGSHVSRILRTLGILERSLGAMNYTERTDSRTYQIAIDESLKPAFKIADEIEESDHATRTHRIEDIAAAREEFLKANQKYAHNQHRPTRNVSPSHPGYRPT